MGVKTESNRNNKTWNLWTLPLLETIMRRANHQILLLADNATLHKPEEVINTLTNIKLHFLQPQL